MAGFRAIARTPAILSQGYGCRLLGKATKFISGEGHMRGVVAKHLVAPALMLALLTLGADVSGAAAAGDANMASCPRGTEESAGFRTYLPDCRTYEMVSPAYSAGFEVIGGTNGPNAWVSADGGTVVGSSLGGFAGNENSYVNASLLGNPYQFERGSTGWGTKALNPPVSQLPSPELQDLSPDLSRSIWLSGENPTFNEQVGSQRLYVRESNGSLVEVGPLSPLAKGSQGYVGGSADLGRLAIRLAGEAGSPLPYWPGDNTTPGEQSVAPRFSLYEYARTGASEPAMVGVRNPESLESAAARAGAVHINEAAEEITQCGTGLGSSGPLGFGTLNEGDVYNAVSPSGYGIFFTAFAGGCTDGTEVGIGPLVDEVYLRAEGESTVPLSEPIYPPGAECTGACAAAEDRAGEFAGASASGHLVFFTTEQPMLNSDEDSTKDLYMEELAGSGRSTHVAGIAQISHDPTSGQAAEVQGVVRVTEDGNRVYFVAKGVLTNESNGNGEVAELERFNLYMYERGSGRTAFVTKLTEGDGGLWGPLNERAAQTSGTDGHYLVFVSEAQPAGTGDVSTAGQLFRYDADTGALVRVSIGQRGQYLCAATKTIEQGYNCNGNVTAGARAPIIARQTYKATDGAAQPYREVNVTPEGTVFFESKAALTPGAQNGYPNLQPTGLINVYEYRDGEVFLITDGVEPPTTVTLAGVAQGKTRFVSATADGGALFLTADSLVPEDTGTQVSIYDAQINGGFQKELDAQECRGESCRGASSTPGVGERAGSVGEQALGNVQAASPKHKKKTHKKKTHKKHHKQHHKKTTHKKAQAGRAGR